MCSFWQHCTFGLSADTAPLLKLDWLRVPVRMHAVSDDEITLQMAQYGSGPQRGPMGQTLMGGLNNVGQRGIPGNAGLGQAALQRQAGNGVNMGALGGASGTCSCMCSQATLFALLCPDVF